MRMIALIISLAVCPVIYSQVNIIPQPASINMGNATFMLPINAGIISTTGDNANFKKSIDFLTSYLETYYKSWSGAKQKLPPSPHPISLGIDVSQNPLASSYTLEVNKNGINIKGHDEEGVFYGIQTLIQLLPPHVSNNKIEIPFLTIKDHPRFGYRGLHLDVGRHFMPVDFIKKYIDYIALHKMNFFHWHLTEDQGWRIEIKKYPGLTQVGAWRNGTIIGRYPGKGNEGIKYEVFPTEIKITPKDAVVKTDNIRHGGFYTQQEIKD